MAKFLEVTCGGERRLINLAVVEEIRPNWDGGADIYFAFNSPNAYEQDCISVKESYSELRERIMVMQDGKRKATD